MNNYKEQLQIIKQGIDEIIGEKELIAKLKKGKKLIHHFYQFVKTQVLF